MKNLLLLTILLALTPVSWGQRTFVTPVDHGQLTSDLNANGFNLDAVAHLTLSTGGSVSNYAGTAGLDDTGLFGDASRLLHVPAPSSISWNAITTDKPTTVAGYGITDALTATQTTSAISTAIGNLTAGSPAQLDTFLETYNRFLADESAASALNTTVAGKLSAASNLSDLASPAAARTSLGLTSTATAAIGTTIGTVAAGDAASRTAKLLVDGLTGNDTTAARGTTHAYATLAAAFAAVQAGDTIELSPGQTYPVPSGGVTLSSLPGVHIQAQGATILAPGHVGASDFRCLTLTGSDDVQVNGGTWDGSLPTGTTSAASFPGTSVIYIYGSNRVILDRVRVQNSPQGGISVVNACDSVRLLKPTVINAYTGIYADGSSTTYPTRLLIDGAIIRDSWSSLNSGSPAYSGGIKLHCSAGHPSVTVRGGVVSRAGQMGVELQGGWDNSLVEGTIIQECDWGVSVDSSKNVTVAQVKARSIFNLAFEAATGANDAKFVGCTADGTSMDGTSTVTYRAFECSQNCSGVSVQSCSFAYCTDTLVYCLQGSTLQFASNTFRTAAQTALYLNGSSGDISGCTFAQDSATASSAAWIMIDATSANCVTHVKSSHFSSVAHEIGFAGIACYNATANTINLLVQSCSTDATYCHAGSVAAVSSTASQVTIRRSGNNTEYADQTDVTSGFCNDDTIVAQVRPWGTSNFFRMSYGDGSVYEVGATGIADTREVRIYSKSSDGVVSFWIGGVEVGHINAAGFKASNFDFSGIPTTADGTASGHAWNNGGVVTIKP